MKTNPESRSTIGLVTDALSQVALLFQTEIRLVRAEFREKFAEVMAAFRASNVTFGGWIANHEVPAAFARHRATVHVPRRLYVEALPGIPTIRVFEALACGIPLVSAPWDDAEGLFPEGAFLKARDGVEVARHLRSVLADRDLAAALRATGLVAIAERHTCDHRAAELLAIVDEIAPAQPAMRKAAS